MAVSSTFVVAAFFTGVVPVFFFAYGSGLAGMLAAVFGNGYLLRASVLAKHCVGVYLRR